MRRVPIYLFGLVPLLAGCGTSADSPAQEANEANKTVVQRMIDAINARDFTALDQVVASDVRRHSGATPGAEVENLEQFKQFLRNDLAAVPDAHQQVKFMLAEGDRVAIYAVYRGTQSGALGPFPPSGRRLQLPFIGILRLQDGKIAEIWVEWDNLNALSQLGHWPPTGDLVPETRR